MLKVYSAKWCPHCHQTIDYLNDNNIEFEYVEMELQPKQVIDKIVEINGGEDWVVPTLEYNGEWREGKIYNEKELYSDLKRMGVPVPST